MADTAWMQQMAEAEEAAEQQKVQHDEVGTEPALSPRSPELSVPVEPPVQERPVVGLRQPPPPPRSERPQHQHRTTHHNNGWGDTLKKQNVTTTARVTTTIKVEQARLVHLEAAERWEEQMHQHVSPTST